MLPPLDVRERIRKLHALLGSSNENEARVANDKLKALLAEHRLTWNDLPAILAAVDPTAPDAEPTEPPDPQPALPNVLALIDRLIEEHISVTNDERMAAALWVLHTHVFDRFDNTPRLAILSPAS